MRKKCNKCGELKPQTDFYSSPKANKHVCRACNRQACSDYWRKKKARLSNKERELYRDDVQKYLLQMCRCRAKRDGIDFNLEYGDLPVPNNCPALGIAISVGPGKVHASSPTVDRLDPSRGYVKGNVVVLSNKANRIKSNATAVEVQAVATWMKENDL